MSMKSLYQTSPNKNDAHLNVICNMCTKFHFNDLETSGFQAEEIRLMMTRAGTETQN